MRLINDSGLADKWADFVEDYYTGGIANKEILVVISKALKVDGVMQGQLINVQQTDGDVWARKGQTRITLSFSIVETATAKTVWEATADGIYIAASASDPAPPVSETIDLAVKKILDNIPNL